MFSLLDWSGVSTHYHHFILVLNLSSPDRLRFLCIVASLGCFYLPVYLAEPPEQHSGDVENRFGIAATENMARLADLAHKKFNILCLRKRTENTGCTNYGVSAYGVA